MTRIFPPGASPIRLVRLRKTCDLQHEKSRLPALPKICNVDPHSPFPLLDIPMRSPQLAVLLSVVLVFGVVSVLGVHSRVNADGPDSVAEEADLYMVVYKTGDLPVWSKDGKWEPRLLMSLMQSTISPSSWEALGGESTMAPYPGNFSIVISTTRPIHAELEALLKRFRSE